MSEIPHPPPRVRDRTAGLRALQHELDVCASDGTALTAAFLDGGPLAAGAWAPTAGNGNKPVPRLAGPLSAQVRDTDLIMLLEGETLLCALPGMLLADGQRRFDDVVDRLGAGPIRLGVVGQTAGESAADLVASAEAAAPLSRDEAAPTGLSLRLAADLRAARRARSALRMFQDDLDGDDYAVLALIVTELVTNGVRHGSASESDSLLIEVVMDDGTLRGVVVDNGPGFEPSTAESDGPGGRGLTIVERAATVWGTADGGRRVWFEMPRAAARASAA